MESVNKIGSNISIAQTYLAKSLEEAVNAIEENKVLLRENASLKAKIESITQLVSGNGVSQSYIGLTKGEVEAVKEKSFDAFWGLYAKKVGRERCQKKFNRLSAEEVNRIFDVLPYYISSTPDIQFRKHPITWLNGKHWNDDVLLVEQDKPKAKVLINDSKHQYPSDQHFKNIEKCKQNRKMVNIPDDELIAICLNTECSAKRPLSKSPAAVTLHSKGYSLGNISSKIFGSSGFLALKTKKRDSRYHKLLERMIKILPHRVYTK